MTAALNPCLGIWPTGDGVVLGRSPTYAIQLSNGLELQSIVPETRPYMIDSSLVGFASSQRRNLALSLFGGDQSALKRLADLRIAIVGLGGIGAAACSALCKLGFGNFILVDDDIVEDSNLHKSFVFSTKSVGSCKADAAASWLTAFGAIARPLRARLEAGRVADIAEVLVRYNPDLVVWAGDSDESGALSELAQRVLEHLPQAMVISGGASETAVIVGPSIMATDLFSLNRWNEQVQRISQKHPGCRPPILNPSLITHVSLAGSLIANEALQFALRPQRRTPLRMTRMEIDLLTLEVTKTSLTSALNQSRR